MFYNNYLRKGMRAGVTGFPGNALFSYSPVPHDWRQANLFKFSFSSVELFSGTHLVSLPAPLHEGRRQLFTWIEEERTKLGCKKLKKKEATTHSELHEKKTLPNGPKHAQVLL